MKYTSWRNSRRIEKEFNKNLNFITDILVKIAKRTKSSQEKFRNAIRRFQESKEYQNFVIYAVKKMVIPLNKANAKTWREAARKGTNNPKFYQALVKEWESFGDQQINAQIQENVDLIKTLPSDVAEKVVRNIQEATLKGYRAEAIEDMIVDKTSQHSKASAKLIARTETAKTQTALIKMRSNELGLRWYKWRTAQDGNRVRKSHRKMEGVLVNWDNPPSPELLVGEESVGYYHAGQIWNCRCYPEPVVKLEYLKFPVKVYINGQIQTMGKKEFSEIF